MARTIRTALAVLGTGAVLALVLQRAGLIGGVAGSPTAALPLSCRLLGHTWKAPGTASGAPTRRTCSRCEHLDLPLP